MGDDSETDVDEVEAETKAEPVQPAAEPASTAGLVKMMRDDKTIHAHPTAIKEHMKNGWKPV